MIKVFLVNAILTLLLVLTNIALLTLLERKTLSAMQARMGPGKVSLKGILQPFTDAMKLLFKEWDYNSLKNSYLLAPLSMLFIALSLWFIYPWMNAKFMNNSFMWFIILLGFNVYPTIILAWSSNCNYAMLAALRSIAQMLSFEIGLFMMLFMLMMLCESFSMWHCKNFQNYCKFFMLMYPLYLTFFASMLIELNRTPFDLIEGESELVSGFNVEYCSSFFAMIFIAEYSNILFTGVILEVMFFGYEFWSFKFNVILFINVVLIIWMRGVLPRIRYDVLMYMCWKEVLISTLLYVIYIICLKFSFFVS